MRGYEVRAGTDGGLYFGSKVPALVVEADSSEVVGIYPHRKSNHEVTIREVLTSRCASTYDMRLIS